MSWSTISGERVLWLVNTRVYQGILLPLSDSLVMLLYTLQEVCACLAAVLPLMTRYKLPHSVCQGGHTAWWRGDEAGACSAVSC